MSERPDSRPVMQNWAAGGTDPLPGKPPKGKRPRGRPEDTSQEAAIAALVRAGYVVAVHTVRRKRCADCGSYERAGDGQTRGHGDYSITRDWLRRHPGAAGLSLWANIEHKAPGGKVKPEQQCAAWRVGLPIVRTAEEALAAGRRFDAFLAAALGLDDAALAALNRVAVGSRGVFLDNWEFLAAHEAKEDPRKSGR